MKNTKLQGTGVALVTPFDNNKRVDYKGLENVVNAVINGGCEYLVVLGTTGESATLTKEEKREVRAAIKRINAGRVPMVLGLGGNNTQAVLTEIQDVELGDYEAILSVCPYYNKPSQEGIYQHFKTIAENSPKPVLLYNVPGRTGVNIQAETTIRLSKISNIIGIKEASGNVEQFMKIVRGAEKDFLVISGDDMTAYATTLLGGDGVISVMAMGAPREFSEMIRFGLKGDAKGGREYQYGLIEKTDLIFKEGNPVGIKALLNIQGLCESVVRLPLVEASADLRSKLAKAQA